MDRWKIWVFGGVWRAIFAFREPAPGFVAHVKSAAPDAASNQPIWRWRIRRGGVMERRWLSF
jgi:hypothetical protein